MKSILPLLFLAVLLFASGCVGNKTVAPTPVPFGNFTGQFRLLHKNKTTLKFDTSKATLNIAMDVVTGYKVTGDTATVHAGSFGTYGTNQGNLIAFDDKTFPITGTPKKAHLSGVYQYYYDGTIFQMVAASALDTLILQYDLKKVN